MKRARSEEKLPQRVGLLLDQMPREVMHLIRQWSDTTSRGISSRVALQRTCKEFYDQDPGLIVPVPLRKWIKYLPVNHPLIHDFVRQLFKTNLLYAFNPRGICDVLREEPAYCSFIDDDMDKHEFVMALEFNLVGPLVIYGRYRVGMGLVDPITTVVFKDDGTPYESKERQPSGYTDNDGKLLWGALYLSHHSHNPEVISRYHGESWHLGEIIHDALTELTTKYHRNSLSFIPTVKHTFY